MQQANQALEKFWTMTLYWCQPENRIHHELIKKEGEEVLSVGFNHLQWSKREKKTSKIFSFDTANNVDVLFMSDVQEDLASKI